MWLNAQKAIAKPTPNGDSWWIHASAGASSPGTSEAGYPQALHRLALPSRQHNPWSCGYARSPRVITSQPIHRTLDAQRAAVHHVQVDHGRRHVPMPEQFLHGPDVIAVFKKMRREGMAQDVRTDTLRDACSARRLRHRLLYHGLVQVISRRRPESVIPADPSRRKHELPPPLRRGIRELAIQREGQDHSPESARQIVAMHPPHVDQVLRQRVVAACGSIVTRSLRPLPCRTMI